MKTELHISQEFKDQALSTDGIVLLGTHTMRLHRKEDGTYDLWLRQLEEKQSA